MWEWTLDLYLIGMMSQIYYVRLHAAQEDEKQFMDMRYVIPATVRGYNVVLCLLFYLL